MAQTIVRRLGSNHFPDEPIGGEAAIIWHLEQIDHFDQQATEADACDMADACDQYDARATAHRTRLKTLEDQFPETAKSARAYMQAKYNQMIKEKNL